VLEEGGPGSGPPPAPYARSAAIAAIEIALAQRARSKRRTRWIGRLAAAAAVFFLVGGGARYLAQRGAWTAAAPPTSPAEQHIVAQTVAGAASVVVGAQAAPVTEGRAMPSGSRVVTAKTGRVLLAFATGTSAVLGDGGDATLDAQAVRLDSGSLDLHVTKQAGDQRFVVRTPDSEVEVRGTQFRVAVVAPDPSCGGGTSTRVSVSEGVVVVRHAGSEARVGAGEQWPAGCDAPSSEASNAALGGGPGVAHAQPSPTTSSTLGEQNDLFARAIAAKRRGDVGDAIAGFDRFLSRYPGSPLAESAMVERMRLLRSVGSSRAPSAANAYLARYPNGFAHAEAEAIVAGAP
jgi:ferric-dicitrate binding protein FerR (iron transport regulator)